MKAELGDISSADAKDLQSVNFDDIPDRAIELTIEVGSKGFTGVDLFYSALVVNDECTEENTTKIYARNGNIFFEGPYDYNLLREFLVEAISAAKGDTWAELAMSLAPVGRWEWTGSEYPPTFE